MSSDGFTFTVKRRNKDSVEWRCSIRNKTTTCPVMVQQRGDQFSSNNKDHIHTSRPGILRAVEIEKEVIGHICPHY